MNWRQKALDLGEDEVGPVCECGHLLYLHVGNLNDRGEEDNSCVAAARGIQCSCGAFEPRVGS